MPNGMTLLIDSGKNGHGQRFRTVMAQAGVTQIEAFGASHYLEGDDRPRDHDLPLLLRVSGSRIVGPFSVSLWAR
jgi:hypothetical protein